METWEWWVVGVVAYILLTAWAQVRRENAALRMLAQLQPQAAPPQYEEPKPAVSPEQFLKNMRKGSGKR